MFRSSCVFIRVASYATPLHYSNIYENYVLKSQQSKHGALLLTLELRLPESHRLSANVGEVKAPARVEIFRQEEVSRWALECALETCQELFSFFLFNKTPQSLNKMTANAK